MLGVVLGKLCLHLCVSIIFPSEMLAAQVLVCLSVGSSVGCTGTCVSIDWVEVLEVLPMLATQVLVCLPISWVEVLEVLLLEVLCDTQYAIPSFRQVGHPSTCVPAYWLC